MSLTGWPILALTGLLLLMFTIAAIGDRPRLRLPRVLRRVVSVLGAQVCAVLVAALALNDWGMFYGSWADIVGGASDEVVTFDGPAAGGAHHARGAALPSSMHLTGWSRKDELTRRGGVFSLPIAGARSHLSTNALVFLPPQYFQKEHANERFPVVETIAGYPGDVPQLVDRLGYPAALDTAIDQGKARPMILVMMKPTLVPPRDTECVDVPGGPQTLTFFSHDVPAVLEADLRVTRGGWGAMGHSTGGYCAAKLAMTNPTRFRTAVSLSGYFTTHEDGTTGSLFGGSATLRNESDLVWRATHLPPPDVAILASIGQDEGGAEGVANSKAFVAAARPPLVTRLEIVHGGGHNFGTYAAVLPSAFDWLSRHVSTS